MVYGSKQVPMMLKMAAFTEEEPKAAPYANEVMFDEGMANAAEGGEALE